MTVSVRCANPIQGSVIRVTSLTTCGVPVTGVGDSDASPGQIVMDGFTQVAQAFQYEEGERKFLRKANGQPCVNFQNQEDALTDIQVTADFCVWHPGLVVAAINACLLTYSESPTGTGFGVLEGIGGKHFSLELWTPLAGDEECDPSTGQALYGYNAWPHVWNGHLGDMTQGADPHALQILGKTKKPSPLWTIGNTWLGTGAVSACRGHWLWNITTAAPPTVPASCSIANV